MNIFQFASRRRHHALSPVLCLTTVVLLLLLSSPTAFGFSLTQSLHRLLQQSSEDFQARELTLQHCGNAIDKDGDDKKNAFSKFIYRGDPVSNLLMYGLTSLGGDQWKDTLLESKELDQDTIDDRLTVLGALGTTGAIVYMVFFGIALILLFIACIMLPGCCSSCWRNCFGKCFCRKCCHDRERARPIQEVSKEKRRLLLGSSLAGVTFFTICACLAIAFSTKFAWSLPGAVCQIARFSVEVKEGVLYNQHPKESSWMSGLPEGADFGGFNAARTYLSTLRKTFVDGTQQENVFERLTETIDSLDTGLQGVLDNTAVNIKALRNVNTQGSFVYMPIVDVMAGDKGTEFSAMLDEGKGKVADSASTAKQELTTVKTELKDPLDKAEDAINDVEKEINRARTEFVNLLVDNGEIVINFSDFSFIPLLVISVLSLVGVVFVLVMVVKLQAHRKRGTEPNHKKYSSWFAFFWGWFAFTGVFLFIVGFTVLMVLSFTDSGCEVVKSAAEDPSILNTYRVTEDIYPDDDTRGFDVCFAPDGDGDLIGIYTEEEMKDAHDSIDKAKEQFAEMEKQPAGKEKYQPLMHSLRNIKATAVMNLVEAAQTKNLVYIHPDILFSGSQKGSGIELTDDDDKAIRDILAERVTRFASDKNFWGYFQNFNDPTCPPKFAGNERKIPSIAAHLDALHEAATEVEPKCKDVQFCIPKLGDACSTKGSKRIDIDSAAPTSHPDFVGGKWESKIDATLYAALLGAGCNLEPLEKDTLMNPATPTCGVYYYNSLLVGIFTAGLKAYVYEQANLKCGVTSCDGNVETIGLMLENFDTKTGTAQTSANSALNAGEAVLNKRGENLNCKAMSYALASVVDGFCGGIQQDLFWIALSWCLMACVSFFFWVICYKVFHYFKDRANAEKKEGPVAVSSAPQGSPSTLMAFAKQGDAKEVDKQMQYIDPTTVIDKNYNTTLHCAAFSGDTETVQKLIEREAPINGRNDFGYTPLGVAASEGHANVVSLLVQRGADPTVHDEYGETALHAAARAGDLPVVEALCQDCAPAPTYLNDEGMVAADTAHFARNVEVETFLDVKTPKYVKRVTRGPSFGFSSSIPGRQGSSADSS